MAAIPFDEILASMTPEQRERIAARSSELIEQERNLREIRESLVLSQEHVAQALGVEQSAVSKMERRADVYVSNLRKYLRALGGTLEIIARFPGQPPVRVTQFGGAVVEPARRGRKKRATAVEKAKPTDPKLKA
jgi:transcriptional regulator with XRE-family HTH domain